jgi:hypothetical protein
MAQEIIRLCKIGKSALESLALSVEVRYPLHPASHAGVQYRQSATTSSSPT